MRLKVWSSASHHMETSLPRLGSKIMLHIRLMIFRHLNDSEEIRGQMPEGLGWALHFTTKMGKPRNISGFTITILLTRRNPLHLKVPHHAMSSSYATSGILCCLPMGEMSNPFWIYLCFFEFDLASLMVTINTATCAIASSPICAFSCSGSCIRQKYCPWAVSENVARALQANNLVT